MKREEDGAGDVPVGDVGEVVGARNRLKPSGVQPRKRAGQSANGRQIQTGMVTHEALKSFVSFSFDLSFMFRLDQMKKDAADDSIRYGYDQDDDGRTPTHDDDDDDDDNMMMMMMMTASLQLLTTAVVCR